MSHAIILVRKAAVVLVVFLLLCSLPLFCQDADNPGILILMNTLRWGYIRPVKFILDGKEIKISRTHYMRINLKSGEHTIHYKGAKKALKFIVRSDGELYFATEEKALGWGGFGITALNEDDARLRLQGMKPQ